MGGYYWQRHELISENEKGKVLTSSSLAMMSTSVGLILTAASSFSLNASYISLAKFMVYMKKTSALKIRLAIQAHFVKLASKYISRDLCLQLFENLKFSWRGYSSRLNGRKMGMNQSLGLN